MTDSQSKPSLWTRAKTRVTARPKKWNADRKTEQARRAREQVLRDDRRQDTGHDETLVQDHVDNARPVTRPAGSTVHTHRSTSSGGGRGIAAIIGAVIALVLILALVVVNISLRNDLNNLANSVDQKIAEATESTRAEADRLKADLAEKDKAIEAANQKAADAEKLAADKDAEKKAVQDQLEAAKRGQSVGNGDGTNAQPGATPADVVTAEQMTAAIQQLKAGGLDPKDGTFTIDWAKNDALQAGAMEFCKPSAHTASALVDRLKSCPLALSTYMEGAGVTEAQALDTNAWVAWQSNKKLHYANGMSFDNNGNVQWGNDFVDPEGAVLWTNTHATKPFFLRDRCFNGTRPPVVTTLQPTFVPSSQPPIKTVVVHVPPKEIPPVVVEKKIYVCIKDSGNQTLVPIKESELDLTIHSEDIADCVKEVKDPENDDFKDDELDGTPPPPGPAETEEPIEDNPAGPPSTDGNAPGDEVVDLPADGADGGTVPDHGTPPPVPDDVPSNPGSAPLEGDVDPDAAVAAAPAAAVAPAAVTPVVAPEPVAVAPVAVAPVVPVVPAPAPVVEAAPAVIAPAPPAPAVGIAAAPAPAVAVAQAPPVQTAVVAPAPAPIAETVAPAAPAAPAPAEAEVALPTVVAAVSATTTG